MRSPGIKGEGELRGQPANSGSPAKMAVKTECVSVTSPNLNNLQKNKLVKHKTDSSDVPGGGGGGGRSCSCSCAFVNVQAAYL